MKGKSRVVRMNHGGSRDYDKIKRQEEMSIRREKRHFQKVNSGFSFIGILMMMGRFFHGFFDGMFNGFYRGEDTTKGTTAAESRIGGRVRSVEDPRNKNRMSKYYKMRVPKSVRSGLSFEELQLVKKALYPRFEKDGVQMVPKSISLEEMMNIRVEVVGF